MHPLAQIQNDDSYNDRKAGLELILPSCGKAEIYASFVLLYLGPA